MAITGTQFNVAYVNDKDVLLHRTPLANKGWLSDGLFDYLKMDNFPEQDLDSVFTLDVSLNVYSETTGLIVLLDTRNDSSNKGLFIALDVALKKIIVQFCINTTTTYALTEFNSIPFKYLRRHNIIICYDGSHPITGLTVYFDGVVITSNIGNNTFNTFGSVTNANNIAGGTIINGSGVGYIGRKNTFGTSVISKNFVLKKWVLVTGIYTKQTSRKSFNTAISSLPNYLVDLDTNKVNGQPITDNEGTVTISQFGGNTYTTFIS